jgi:hypothetical protein
VKIALATTTIHIPHALKLMRKCSADVRFFVAIDEKTPEDAGNFCAYDVDNTQVVYLDAEQRWKCGKAIGRNTLAKRNLAFLEALAWGADIIYSWDTDNIPVSPNHFDLIEKVLSTRFDGLLGSSKTGWFDAGHMLNPWARHRGIPYNNVAAHEYNIATNPDIDATLRMEKAPEIHTISKLGEMGVIVDVNTHTVFNTQNVAMLRDLVPSWFLMPGVGRYDDLYASLIVQRVVRERGLHVHFGQPLVWQQRHEHNLHVDLKAEISGMENIVALADLLDSIILPGKSVIADTRIIYEVLGSCPFIPEQAVKAALLWLEDCEGVL